MKVFIILNPATGKNSREPILDALKRYFTNSLIDYEIYETTKEDKPGDIVQARLSDKFDLVVAAVGDGTVSAVIDGLVGSTVPLGIIPAGTRNLIAHELNIPVVIEEAVALISSAHIYRKIDTMRIGKRVYTLNVSLGISASVAGGTTSKNKNCFERIVSKR